MYRAGDTVADRYGVQRVIAAGGMAEVYEVRDAMTGAVRALKTPNDRYADNQNIVERMVREARALQAIDDKNLVKVHDAGVHEDRFFMVMDLLDGVTLRELSRQGPLPTGVVLRLVNQLAWALHVLHQLGHVHRDVKPDNCMVLEAEGEPTHRLVLIDLGVTKFAGATTTSEGVALGTLTYMAPEQITGGRVDQRADIYALGLIMYELVARVHPLEIRGRIESRNEWVERQKHYLPDPLDQTVKGVHPALSNLVMRCIAKDPAQRLATAAELAGQLHALAAMLRGSGLLGAERLEPFDRREPVKGESGPEPVARIRPPNTETPGPYLGFQRTDMPEPAAPEPTPEPLPLKAEPPRVTPQPEKRVGLKTVPMLGPAGTKPHLPTAEQLAAERAKEAGEAAGSPSPGQVGRPRMGTVPMDPPKPAGRPRAGTVPMNTPEPGGRPRMGTVPMDPPKPAGRPRQGTVPIEEAARPEPKPTAAGSARPEPTPWRDVPAGAPLQALEPADVDALADAAHEEVVDLRLTHAGAPKEKAALRIPDPPPRGADRARRREQLENASNVGLWLRAMAVGLLLALVSLAIVAAIALGREKPATHPAPSSNGSGAP